MTLPTIEDICKEYAIESMSYPSITITEEAQDEEWLYYLAKLWRIEESQAHRNPV